MFASLVRSQSRRVARGIPLCCNVQIQPLEPNALVPIDNMHLPPSDYVLAGILWPSVEMQESLRWKD